MPPSAALAARLGCSAAPPAKLRMTCTSQAARCVDALGLCCSQQTAS